MHTWLFYIWLTLSLVLSLVVSKCLTLLIEISPINNTKVLKAVDCRVKVQVVCVVLASFMQVLLQSQADIAVMDHLSLQCMPATDGIFYKRADSALASICIFSLLLT